MASRYAPTPPWERYSELGGRSTSTQEQPPEPSEPKQSEPKPRPNPAPEKKDRPRKAKLPPRKANAFRKPSKIELSTRENQAKATKILDMTRSLADRFDDSGEEGARSPVKELVEHLQSMTDAAREQVAADERVRRLQSEARAMSKEIQEERAKYSKTQGVIAQLSGSLAKMAAHIKTAEEELSRISDQRRPLEAEIERLKQKLSRQNEAVARNRASVTHLEKRVVAVRKSKGGDSAGAGTVAQTRVSIESEPFNDRKQYLGFRMSSFVDPPQTDRPPSRQGASSVPARTEGIGTLSVGPRPDEGSGSVASMEVAGRAEELKRGSQRFGGEKAAVAGGGGMVQMSRQMSQDTDKRFGSPSPEPRPPLVPPLGDRLQLPPSSGASEAGEFDSASFGGSNSTTAFMHSGGLAGPAAGADGTVVDSASEVAVLQQDDAR